MTKMFPMPITICGVTVVLNADGSAEDYDRAALQKALERMEEQPSERLSNVAAAIAWLILRSDGLPIPADTADTPPGHIPLSNEE